MCTFQHVVTKFGLEVKWTGESKIEIVAPPSWKNATCGLCGNFNDYPTDDWTVGPGCPDNGIGNLVGGHLILEHMYFACSGTFNCLENE